MGNSSHLQSSLLPHFGQLQSHNSSDVLHPLHFVYSAKSSLIDFIRAKLEIKFEKIFLKTWLFFLKYFDKFKIGSFL